MEGGHGFTHIAFLYSYGVHTTIPDVFILRQNGKNKIPVKRIQNKYFINN